MIMQPEEEEGNEQRLNWRKDGSPQQRCPSREWRISSLGPAYLRDKVGVGLMMRNCFGWPSRVHPTRKANFERVRARARDAGSAGRIIRRRE